MNDPVLGAKVEKRRRSPRGKGQTMAERQFESDRAARPEQGQHMPRPGPSKYERAVMWAFDRLSVDNLTAREIAETRRQLGMVLLGRECAAVRYEPNEWDDSARLPDKGRAAS